MIALFSIAVISLFPSLPVAEVPTADDVLQMMSRIPNECTLYGACPKGWGAPHYEKLNDAREIAEAIAMGVRVEGDPWSRAAIGAIYAAFESNNRRCASGDGGRSWGAWQCQGLSKMTACDPMREFPMWLAMVTGSEKTCGDLSLVASGSCSRGKDKVRRRAALVPQVMGLPLE